MSDATEAAKVLVDASEKAVAHIADAAQKLAEQYGQPSLHLLLDVARIEAASSLFCGLFLCLLTGLLWFGIYKICKLAPKNNDEVAPALTALIGGSISLFTFSFGMINLFSVWAWIGLFRPEIWLAHKALEAVQ